MLINDISNKTFISCVKVYSLYPQCPAVMINIFTIKDRIVTPGLRYSGVPERLRQTCFLLPRTETTTETAETGWHSSHNWQEWLQLSSIHHYHSSPLPRSPPSSTISSHSIINSPLSCKVDAWRWWLWNLELLNSLILLLLAYCLQNKCYTNDQDSLSLYI